MTVETVVGRPVSTNLLYAYFGTMVNQVYKILPMRENGQASLPKYIWRLEAELIGHCHLIPSVSENPYFASLLGILHYLNENGSACSVLQVKHLVFEAIHLCGMLKESFVPEAAREGQP